MKRLLLICFMLIILVSCSQNKIINEKSYSSSQNQVSKQSQVDKDITLPTSENNDTKLSSLSLVVGKTSKFVVYEEAPYPVKKTVPVYPEFAKKSGIQGDVWLEVEVFKDGTVGAVEVKQSLMSGPNGLDQAAVNAVKQWQFMPAKSGGKPIACWVTFPIGFYLGR